MLFSSPKVLLATLALIVSQIVSSHELTQPQQSLTLYVYTPIKSINWSTPANSLKYAIGNDMRKRWIKLFLSNINISLVGHTVIRYQCEDSTGQSHDVWTGLTGQNNVKLDLDNVLNKKMGLGVAFEDYIDGVTLDSDYSRNEVSNFYGPKRRDEYGKRRRQMPRFIRFPINTSQCDNIIEFYNTFRSLNYDWRTPTPLEVQAQKPANEILYFGFMVDPYESYLRYKESGGKTKLGGACASFGMSFLKLVDKFDDSFEDLWKINLNVSELLIAGPTSTLGEDHKIKFLELLYGKVGKKWEHEGYTNRQLSFFDPEKIWFFLGGVNNCARFRNGEKERMPACSDEILAWYDDNADQIHHSQRDYVDADRIKTTIKRRYKSTLSKTTKTPYTTKIRINGIQLGL